MESIDHRPVFIRMVLANLMLAFLLFWWSSPIGYIPSDDLFFILQIDKYFISLDTQERANWFLPQAYFEFTKPFLVFLAGLLRYGVYLLTPFEINDLQALLFFNYVPFALNGFLLQALAYRVAPSNKLMAAGLSGLLYYTSISVFSSLQWTGYTHFVTFLILLLYGSLHHSEEKQDRFGWRYVCLVAILIAMLVFTHLSVLPFIAAGFVAWLLCVDRFDIERKAFMKTRFVLLIKIGLVAVVLIAFINWVSGWGGEATYIETFIASFKKNLVAHFDAEHPRVEWLYHVVVFLYYLSLEAWFTLALLAALAFLWIAKIPLSPFRFFKDSQGRLLLCSMLLAILFISITSNTKLLRTFFPAHLAALHLLLMTLLYIKEKVKEKKIPAMAFPTILLIAGMMSAVSIKENACSLKTTSLLPHQLYKSILDRRLKSTALYVIPQELSVGIHTGYWRRAHLPSRSIWYDPGLQTLVDLNEESLPTLSRFASVGPGFLLTGKEHEVPGFTLQKVLEYPPCHNNQNEIFQEEVATQKFLLEFLSDPLGYFGTRLFGDRKIEKRFYLYSSN